MKAMDMDDSRTLAAIERLATENWIRMVAEKERKKKLQNQKSVQNPSPNKSAYEKFRQPQLGKWSDVCFSKGKCTISPHISIAGKKFPSLTINIPESTEEVNKYMERYADRLPLYVWMLVSKDKEIMVDKDVFRQVCRDFQQAKEEEKKRICSSEHVLDWKSVFGNKGKVVLQPHFSLLKVKKFTITSNRSFVKKLDCLRMYNNKLPQVKYRISETMEVIDFDHNALSAVLDELQRILDRIATRRPRIPSGTNKEKLMGKTKSIKDEKIENKVVEKEGCSVLKRTLEDFYMDGVDRSIFADTHILQWSDVKFYNGYFVFEPDLEGKIGRNKIQPFRMNDHRCKSSYNYFRDHFQVKLPKVLYKITTDFKIRVENKPMFEVAMIDLTKESLRHKGGVDVDIIPGVRLLGKCSFKSAMSKAAMMKPEDFRKYKSQFIDFLVEHQLKRCKIAPVTESISHLRGRHEEQAFLFTVRSWKGNLYIIAENLNADRATMIFEIPDDGDYMMSLKGIYDYIQSDEINKRSAVRDKNTEFKGIKLIDHFSVNHDSPEEWKANLYWKFQRK